jgi:hypothetical protein
VARVTEEVPPYVRFLAAAIEASIDELTKASLLELEEDQRTPLVAELLAKAAQAETPKRMLKSLVRALVDSENVVEVYADDDVLRAVFERHCAKD